MSNSEMKLHSLSEMKDKYLGKHPAGTKVDSGGTWPISGRTKSPNLKA
jgi:hypothetical protein